MAFIERVLKCPKQTMSCFYKPFIALGFEEQVFLCQPLYAKVVITMRRIPDSFSK